MSKYKNSERLQEEHTGELLEHELETEKYSELHIYFCVTLPQASAAQTPSSWIVGRVHKQEYATVVMGQCAALCLYYVTYLHHALKVCTETQTVSKYGCEC